MLPMHTQRNCFLVNFARSVTAAAVPNSFIVPNVSCDGDYVVVAVSEATDSTSLYIRNIIVNSTNYIH